MKFDHLAIPVEDVINVMRWFQEVHPDTEVLYSDEEWCFLRIGETKLAFVQEDQHPPHFAFSVDKETLLTLSNQYDKEISQRRDDTLSFYIIGPENVCIEFVTYLRDFNVERDSDS